MFEFEIKPVFDNDVDTEDCSEAIGVILTDDDNDELQSPDFSSRGRFCFFFTGSFVPEPSIRSLLFTFTLSQSAFSFDNFIFFESVIIELRKFSFSKSSPNLCDDLN